MMSKPVIGVIGSFSIFPSAKFHNVEKFHINTSYLNAVINNGGIPLPISVINDDGDLAHILRNCDGLLIPGGDDIDPGLFGENPHPKIGAIRPDIDRYVLKVLDIAYRMKMPVLGICYGMQIINVSKGGSVYQDMSLVGCETILHTQTYDRSFTTHKIKIDKNAYLHKVLGEDEIYVNTMHHQAVKSFGNGLYASACAPDGIIEALESADGLILATQWHPEELLMSSPKMNNIFSYFINRMTSLN